MLFRSLALTEERCEQLGLLQQVKRNETPLGTAFTESIEAREGITTGISAPDRSRTIMVAIDPDSGANDLVKPGGRLCRQRDLAHELISQIPGVSCFKPKAALYLFPRLDMKMYPVTDDQQFILELLQEQKVLVVQGTGFNWPHTDHFRVVFLPNSDDLTEAIGRIARFLETYRKRHATG